MFGMKMPSLIIVVRCTNIQVTKQSSLICMMLRHVHQPKGNQYSSHQSNRE